MAIEEKNDYTKNLDSWKIINFALSRLFAVLRHHDALVSKTVDSTVRSTLLHHFIYSRRKSNRTTVMRITRGLAGGLYSTKYDVRGETTLAERHRIHAIISNVYVKFQ
jgi:hypothetical protein